MLLSPKPSLHPSHRGAKDQLHMLKTQFFGKEPVLSLDHVEVAVLRKFCTKTIGWLARSAEAYAVRHNDKEFLDVERLAFAIKLLGKAWRKEFFACFRRPVKEKNGVWIVPLALLWGVPKVM